MLKVKTFVIIIIIYLVSFISVTTKINLFYLYYLLKDLIYMPVKATSNDLKLDSRVCEGINLEKEKELEELKKINDLSSTLTDFDSVTSLVLNRNKMYWFNTLEINSGSNSKIDVGDAVISSSGLIGIINKVSKKTSEVKLITTSDINTKISVMIKTNNDTIYGIMNNYNKEDNYLEITTVNKISDLDIKNSLVYTSGLGGILPSGILIGTVREVVKDKYDVTNIIHVTLSSNINDLKYVKVLKRK